MDVLDWHRMRQPFDVFVFEDGFDVWVLGAKTHDHAMHRRITASLVAPLKGTVCKVGVHAQALHFAPQHGHLFALRDAVGRYKGGLLAHVPLHVSSGKHIPATHKVQNARAVLSFATTAPQLDLLSPDDLFTPFEDHPTAVAGLGLASVRRIAEAHGGDCRLLTEPGHRLALRIELPL